MAIHKDHEIPEIPLGEDKFSFMQHNKRIQQELCKATVNKAIVNELVDQTYALRRRDILMNPTDVETTFNKYPFL